MLKDIQIINADINNLKQLNVSFALNHITMVVGRSGSGKSSLLEHVIAKEGNQRLQHFLHIKDKGIAQREDLAFINKLPPTVLVGQKSFNASKRTTIGTSSGLLNIIRKLFIRYSAPVSHISNQSIGLPTAQLCYQWLMNHCHSKVKIWAIPLDFEDNNGIEIAAKLAQGGFDTMTVRSETDSEKVFEKGRQVKTKNFKGFNTQNRRIIEVPVGEFMLDQKQNENLPLRQAIEKAFDLANGKVFIEFCQKDNKDIKSLDTRYHRLTPEDPNFYAGPNKHNLTFNSPSHQHSGACEHCQGLGRVIDVDLSQLISQPNLSMHQGALALWTKKNYKYISIGHDTIEGLRGIEQFDPDTPWQELPKKAQRLILEGAGDVEICDIDSASKKKTSSPRKYAGIKAAILERVIKPTKIGDALKSFVQQQACKHCEGTRWSSSTRALKLHNWQISQLLAADFKTLNRLFEPDGELSMALDAQGQALCRQLYQLTETFNDVGLGHLCGARQMTDISDGESRRLRLAAVLYAQLNGICLLLDEPTRGLHENDITAINKIFHRLRGGNTLIINDHRRKLANIADTIVALGPEAGENGGQLLTQSQIKQSWEDIDALDTGVAHHQQPVKGWLNITNANYHHIHSANICLPFGQLVTIAGVSGSGKSSFVKGILLPVLHKLKADNTAKTTLEHVGLAECEPPIHIDNVIELTQKSPTTNKRSTLATFLDIAASIRDAYAKQAKAEKMPYSATDFSSNSGNGRCEVCLGLGEIEDDIGWQTCSHCGGQQFNQQILTVTCDNLTIYEFLNTPISQLVASDAAIIVPFKPLLDIIVQLGVGHLALGRRSIDVSGGEIQRLKIAKQLALKTNEHNVFILDEPAAGLHPIDVQQLHQTLNQLVKQSHHSVVIIEHNIALIAKSDWVIEFGPECGAKGGKVMAQDAPESLLKLSTPTAEALQQHGIVDKLPAYREVNQQVATLESSQQNLAKIKALIGYDVLPAASENTAPPAMIVDRENYTNLRLLEFGGLINEVIALALDCQNAPIHSQIESFIAIWGEHKQGQLRINPLLNEMAIWDEYIPKSVIEKYSKERGFVYDKNKPFSPKDCRITVPSGLDALKDGMPDKRALLHALDYGAGYVELCEGQQVLAKCAVRTLELDNYNVGPRKPLVASYIRQHSNAQCPVCQGKGTIDELPEALLFGDQNSPLEQSSFLNPSIFKFTKGIYRSELLPFFKHMIKEQLWPAQTSLNQLNQKQKQVLLYGFWHRPSYGSFLKAKKDAKEVGSWLKWDGLINMVMGNKAKGDKSWLQRFNDSIESKTCFHCEGSGLARFSQLLMLGDSSIQKWLNEATVEQLYRHVANIQSDSPRVKARALQIQQVLQPLINSPHGQLPLHTPLLEGPWQLIIDSTLKQLSTLTPVAQEH